MHAFSVHRPSTLDEAMDLLYRCRDPKVLAGGQTLLPVVKQRLADPSDLIDLSDIEDLSGIRMEDGRLVVGAMETHDRVARSPDVQRTIPALAQLAAGIGDPQVRHRGTLGGSIANADPAADYPAALVGLGATVRTSHREIPAELFFTGLMETALEEREIVTEVTFRLPRIAAYMKMPVPASRFALVGVFLSRGVGGVRVAVTGAADRVFRAPKLEGALSAYFTPEAIDRVEIDPAPLSDDRNGSAEYRAHLIKVLAKRAILAAVQEQRSAA